jgi:hypothetical protein
LNIQNKYTTDFRFPNLVRWVRIYKHILQETEQAGGGGRTPPPLKMT